ncbi:hypothetical protein ABE073_05190 [Lederbergia citrisecunda]
MEHHTIPTIEELTADNYLPEDAKCPDGTEISIDDGIVIARSNHEDD